MVKLPSQPATLHHLIGAEKIAGSQTLAVESPYTGQTVAQVPLGSPEVVAQAVAAAKQAQAAWRSTPIKERSRPLFKLRDLVTQHRDELANLAAVESGKTIGEAAAGIDKGLEVVEFALSLQNLDDGGAMDVSRGVRCELRREPLGIVAGIVPFNFPAMVPMWMFPIAVTVGNCFILKPSEKVPMTMNRMGELMLAAGYPPGVFQIVHGDRTAAEALIAEPQVRAIGFVGSTPAAQAVYTASASQGKRCMALGGAKNHLLVVPDADPDLTIPGVISSFTGCAGQRCMAASLMVAVGDVDAIINGITERAQTLQLGKDMGAIIDEAALTRIRGIIANAEKEGAKVILDGTKTAAPAGFEGGYWLGPTVIDHAEPHMECAKVEIFGPVLTIVRRPNLAEAMALEAANPFGNATSVFTTSGSVARYVSEHATNGMIGINIGVPVPREPFSFGGTKESKFGHGDITGRPALDFWTDLKKVTTKWSAQSDANWMS